MKTCSPQDGCISKNQILDGFIGCPNRRVPVGNFARIDIRRLNNTSECGDETFSNCDNSTCYKSDISKCNSEKCLESNVICISYFNDTQHSKTAIQCADDSLILSSQFCDGIIDCDDGSDEVINQPGFQCNECILPQSNLYDDVAHCANNSDLCFNSTSACFECFDKLLLISSAQVCDGIDDCYDMSDECLCENYFESNMCENVFERRHLRCFSNNQQETSTNLIGTNNITTNFSKLLLTCATKFGSTIAVMCDGRPECRDFSDECDCENPPRFCNDGCRNFFPMGDRYCDGVEDPAWRIISNESACPRGFDEIFCDKRFKCPAGGNVSIDIRQICDGTADCDDQSDETNCSTVQRRTTTFSSDTEMIAEPVIKAAFWIMGFVVLLGNAYVIITKIVFLRNKNKLDCMVFQHVIILNISIADFIMGIYLITIASYDASFSGIYGLVDREWRTSLRCSIIGSLAVFSSEASCFLMVILTAFRFKNITKAIESLSSSLRSWKFYVIAAWLFSLSLSIAPILNVFSQYFVHSFSYSSTFQNLTLSVNNLERFACRIAVLRNMTIEFVENEYQSVIKFVETGLPNNTSITFLGYYGDTSICMPRFYVAVGESSWEYTISIITVNFLSFLYIAVSYVLIWKYSSKSSANIRKNQKISNQKQDSKMQKRIARIIATDFCCWIPICILAYVRLGVYFSDIAYQISAVLLLPINSALNPFLFSSLPDQMIKWCRGQYKRIRKVVFTRPSKVSTNESDLPLRTIGFQSE